MVEEQETLQEILDKLIELRDEYDWELTGIGYELKKPTGKALKLLVIQKNPLIRYALEKIKDSINQIDNALDSIDLEDDEPFARLYSIGLIDFDGIDLKKNVESLIKFLEATRGKKNIYSKKTLDDMK